jgi:hypothetical protein
VRRSRKDKKDAPTPEDVMPLTKERETELRQHFRVWAYLAPFDREEAEFFARLWVEHVHWEHGGAEGYNQFRQKIAAYDAAAAILDAPAMERHFENVVRLRDPA